MFYVRVTHDYKKTSTQQRHRCWVEGKGKNAMRFPLIDVCVLFQDFEFFAHFDEGFDAAIEMFTGVTC